jgi:hypothetical protein
MIAPNPNLKVDVHRSRITFSCGVIFLAVLIVNPTNVHPISKERIVSPRTLRNTNLKAGDSLTVNVVSPDGDGGFADIVYPSKVFAFSIFVTEALLRPGPISILHVSRGRAIDSFNTTLTYRDEKKIMTAAIAPLTITII